MVITGWKDGQYRKKEIFELHGTRHDSCVCSPPYKLFRYPSAITDEDGRNC